MGRKKSFIKKEKHKQDTEMCTVATELIGLH